MIPSDVQALLVRQISSSVGLHALLLLQRSAETFWTPVAAAAAIEAPPDDVADAMKRMEAADLLECASGTVAFRYKPANDDLRVAVERLVDAYQHNRYGVLDALHGRLPGEPLS